MKNKATDRNAQQKVIGTCTGCGRQIKIISDPYADGNYGVCNKCMAKAYHVKAKNLKKTIIARQKTNAK